jgi:hypothetical protein
MNYAGLAAAIAFMAASASAAAVTENSLDQFRQRDISLEPSLGSSLLLPDGGEAGSLLIAQGSTGDCQPDPDCGENESEPFQFEYLPYEDYTLDQTYDFMNEVQNDGIPNWWNPPHVNAVGWRSKIYGDGGFGVNCLAGGSAIMFSVKTQKLGCWRRVKAVPVIRLKAPALDSSAKRLLSSCKFSTGSVIIRKGGFACIATPRAVVRMAAKGVPDRRLPVRTLPRGG